MKVAWFSCGATSAVACKLALELYGDVKILYIETGSHHPDNARFLTECEKWYGQKIEILQSAYISVFDVIRRTRFINSSFGASCTNRLKVRARQDYEYLHPEITHHIWGFEIGAKEEKRAQDIIKRYPDFGHLFPLQEKNLTKENCLCILSKAGIEIPKMYKLGYHNNNCIGCIKGGMGYWNKIRKDFPDVFDEMAKVEREIGHSCLKQHLIENGKHVFELVNGKKKYKYTTLFLDELDVNRGNHKKELMPECGIFCDVILREVV